MDLINETIAQAFGKYPLYSQDGKGGKAEIVAKYFLPGTSWTWYALEGQEVTIDEQNAKAIGCKPGPTWQCFGIVVNDHNPGGEYGYFTIAELESICIYAPIKNGDAVIGRIPLHVERDINFKPRQVAQVEGLNYYDDEDDDTSEE